MCDIFVCFHDPPLPREGVVVPTAFEFDGLVLDKEPRSDLCSLRRHGQRYTSPGKRDMMSPDPIESLGSGCSTWEAEAKEVFISLMPANRLGRYALAADLCSKPFRIYILDPARK